jgi:hypothetical protein
MGGMQNQDDVGRLSAYAERGSEEAFAELKHGWHRAAGPEAKP